MSFDRYCVCLVDSGQYSTVCSRHLDGGLDVAHTSQHGCFDVHPVTGEQLLARPPEQLTHHVGAVADLDAVLEPTRVGPVGIQHAEGDTLAV